MFSGATGFNLDEFYLGFAKIYSCLSQFSAAHKSPLPKYNTINETGRQYGSTTSGSTLALKKTFLTDVEKNGFRSHLLLCRHEFSWIQLICCVAPAQHHSNAWMNSIVCIKPCSPCLQRSFNKKYLSSTYFIAMSTKFACSFVFLHLVCARCFFFSGSVLLC